MYMHDLLEVDTVFSHSLVILKNDQYLLEGTVHILESDNNTYDASEKNVTIDLNF